ncbi:hypothetical protein J6590_087006 [Homalodisca vitripennis]|nr:hypothetical protein J6590_087006 [Homalodisca vitripennis]
MDTECAVQGTLALPRNSNHFNSDTGIRFKKASNNGHAVRRFVTEQNRESCTRSQDSILIITLHCFEMKERWF